MPPEERKRLDIVVEVNKLKELYAKRGRKKFNALVYGQKGSGKTTLFSTCRKPVFIDSFDPGGTIVLRDEIEAGDIIIDTRWENEDPRSPIVWDEWERTFRERLRGGFLDAFATYGVDSFTTMSQAAMNSVLKSRGRAGGVPQTGSGSDNDYVGQMLKLENALALMFSIPCDLLLICHPESEKDEITGSVTIGPMITGKAKIRIPLLFDELYFAKGEAVKDGVKYTLQTRLTKQVMASSRLARKGLLEMHEEPNIKLILKKAGYPTEDLPRAWEVKS